MSPGHWDTPLMASEKRFCVYTLFSRILTWFQNVPSLPKCFSQTKLLQNGWDFFFSDMRELLLGQQFKLLLCIVLNAFRADLRIQLFANI